MATPSPPSGECGICFQIYSTSRRARIMPCGHDACADCMESLLKRGILTCPWDQKTFELSSITKLPELALVDPNTRCTVCDDEEHAAALYCPECGESLCDFMVTAHKRNRLTKEHALVPLSEKDTAKPENAKCAEHGVEFSDYDLNCKTLVCLRCLSYTHHGHKCQSLQEAAKVALGEMKSDAAKWDSRSKELRDEEALTAASIAQLDVNKDACTKGIKAHFAEILNLVGVREAQLLDEVEQAHKAKSFALSAHLDRLQDTARALEDAVTGVRELEGKQPSTVLLVRTIVEAKGSRAMAARGELRLTETPALSFVSNTSDLAQKVNGMGGSVILATKQEKERPQVVQAPSFGAPRATFESSWVTFEEQEPSPAFFAPMFPFASGGEKPRTQRRRKPKSTLD